MSAIRLPLVCLYLATSSNGFIISSAARSSSTVPLATGTRFLSTQRQQQQVRHMSSSSSASPGLTDIGGGGGDKKDRKNNNNRRPSPPDDAVIPWRERINGSIARSRKIRGGNYVQIATVDSETSEPRCRTVVFRGFLPMEPNEDGSTPEGESTVMKMITDLRSSKVSEASGGIGSAELVWWFAKSSEQYRVRGRLQFVGGGNFDGDNDAFLARMRKEQWGNLSDMAREQFYWKDPSVEYSPQAEVPEGGRGDDGKVLPPPDNFLLMLLRPTYVDYLRLGDNFRQIDQIDADQWVEKRVNP